SILKMLRYKVIAEVNEALGIIDLVLEYSAKRVYIMEIKFEATESEPQKTLEGGPGAENLAKTGKTKRTKGHEERVKITLARLLESAREQIKLNRYDARYGDEFETVHRVAVAVTDRTRVAVEIY
ncbi:MAG: PD-(D/E)XK nuclease domain-containing protein, partial [Deltaproteobacteria bacterium]|nr:PD-(D/E)XK nuclease domain-containing protein [Deltaproteobacteria bacterium]